MMSLARLSRRFLRKQWKRTLFTSLGIVMATALLAGVALLLTSFIQMFVTTETKTAGAWHYHLSGISVEEAEKLSANIRTDQADIIAISRYQAVLEGDISMMILRDASGLQAGLTPYSAALASGRLPANENEIALNYFTASFFPDCSLGDRVSLTLTDAGSGSRQTFVREFTLVGIFNWFDTQLPDQASWAVTIVPENEQAGAEIYLTVRPAASYSQQLTSAMLDALPEQADLIRQDTLEFRYRSYDDDPTGMHTLRLQTHDSLLRYIGQTSSDTTNKELAQFFGLLMLIILVSVIFVIRNSFAMSISERISEFGLLRVVGGSPAQIRRLVLQDALQLAIIGIPAGLLAGVLAMKITLDVVSGLDVPYVENITLVVSPWPLLLAAALSLAAILLAALSPAIRAGRLSPMEAIRRTDSYHTDSAKKAKARRRAPRSLGGPAVSLARRSVHRDRRRFRNTSLSVAISVVLFLAAGGISLAFRAQLSGFDSETVDFRLSASSEQDLTAPAVLADARKQLEPESAVSRMALYSHFYQDADLDPALITRDLQDAMSHYYSTAGYSAVDSEQLLSDLVNQLSSVRLIALDEAGLASLNLPDEAQIARRLRDGEALLCQMAVFNMNGLGMASVPMTTLQPGDTLTLQPYMAYDRQEEGNEQAVGLPDSWRIAGEVTTLPWFVEGVFTGSPNLILIVDRDYLSSRYVNPDPSRYAFDLSELLAIEVQDGHETVIAERLANLYPDASNGLDSDLQIQNNYEQMKMMRNLLLIIDIFVYGFATVIILICSMNILNTVTTNVLLRRRELAMLQAVGMSRGQVGRMLLLECSLYAMTGAFCGALIGTPLLYLLSNSIGGTVAGLGMSNVPWLLIGGTVAGALLLAVFSGIAPIRRILNERVVEAIRGQE